MRILALSADAYHGRGGIAQYNRDLLHALAASVGDIEVHLLPRRMAAASAGAPPAHVVEHPAEGVRWRYVARAMRLATTGGPFDWVLAAHLRLAPLAGFLAHRRDTRLWIQAHGTEAWACPGRLGRAAVEYASLVTAVSRFTRERLLSWTNLDPDRVRVLPNTVATRFTPGPADPGLRRELAPAGGPMLLTVGRLDPRERYKGHDRIIERLSALHHEWPGLRYVVAGDGEDRPRLERLAVAAGVGSQVRFIGAVDGSDLVALYRSADAFAMPSVGEGFGIVFLEAASCGLPVLGGNADGSVDALADGRVGECVDPRDPVALEAALRRLLGRPREVPAAVSRFSRGEFTRHLARIIAGVPPCGAEQSRDPPGPLR